MPDFGMGDLFSSAPAAAGTVSGTVADNVAGTVGNAANVAGQAGTAANIAGAAAPASDGIGNAFSIGNSLAKVGTVVGGLIGAGSQLKAGSDAQGVANFNAGQAINAGNNAMGAATAEVEQNDRKTALTLSANRARAAAGGGAATDPSVVNNAEQIAGQGQYNALMDLFNGASRQNADFQQANLDLYEGQQAKTSSYLKAGTTLLSTGSSMYNRYNANAPGQGLA